MPRFLAVPNHSRLPPKQHPTVPTSARPRLQVGVLPARLSLARDVARLGEHGEVGGGEARAGGREGEGVLEGDGVVVGAVVEEEDSLRVVVRLAKPERMTSYFFKRSSLKLII